MRRAMRAVWLMLGPGCGGLALLITAGIVAAMLASAIPAVAGPAGLGLLLVGTVGGGTLLFAPGRAHRKAVRELRSLLGARYGWAEPSSVAGMPVNIANQDLLLTVEGLGPGGMLAFELSLRPLDPVVPGLAVFRRPGAPPVTGALPSFDALVSHRGPADVQSAVLTAPVRRALRELGNSLVFSWNGERLRLQLPARHPVSEIVNQVEAAGAVLASLAIPAGEDPDAHIARRLDSVRQSTDEPAVVRRRAAVALLSLHSTSTVAVAAAPSCLESGAPQVRLLAARVLGEGGRATLLALAEDEGTPLEHRCDAVARLADLAPDAATARGLCALPDDAPPSLAAAVLTTLGALSPDGFGSDEPWIIGFLKHEYAAVREAACDALGAAGGRAAVEPLLLAASRSMERGGVGRSARAAVAGIQHRLGDAGRGGLAVEAVGGGELSVLEEEGRLSQVAGGGLSAAD